MFRAMQIWFDSLLADSIRTWQQLLEKFLAKYYMTTKNAQMRGEIITFKQWPRECVNAAWEWFKKLVRRCFHHGLPTCILIECFYDGLSYNSKMLVNTSSNGAFVQRTFNEANDILDDTIAHNNNQWGEKELQHQYIKIVVGIHEIDKMSSMKADVESINNTLKTLFMGNQATVIDLTLICLLCVLHVMRITVLRSVNITLLPCFM